jgi:hypothetical protein
MREDDDLRWSKLLGGYKQPCDPHALVRALEAETDRDAAWVDLWEELHHQGDVGEASYAAVPLLVEAHRKLGIVDWNTYAIVAIVELARTEPQNPDLPHWLTKDYFQAIQELARLGAVEVFCTEDVEVIRAILSIISIARGARTHAKFLMIYSGDELLAMESKA